jgi:hypothetical protein
MIAHSAVSSLQRSGRMGRNPARRPSASLKRSAHRPAGKAVCIACPSPKAKLNSSASNAPQICGGFGAWRARARILPRPSADPSDASISHAARPDETRADTFSNPDVSAPARRARPKRSRHWRTSLCGAGEAAFARRLLNGRAIRRDPKPPPWEFAPQIRRHRPIRCGDEADQPRLPHHRAGHEVAALAGRFG